VRLSVNIDNRLNAKGLNKDNDLLAFVNFRGDFKEDSGEEFCKDLNAAENKAKHLGQSIIPISINSYGGAVDALMSMVDAIEHCSLPVATIVSGKAMSCGAFLFSCGAKGHRYIGPNSRVMIHEVSSVHFGKNEDLKTSATETERLNIQAFKILDKNCNKPNGYFQELIHTKYKNSDWFLNPEECVKHNLASVIGIPTLKLSVKMNTEFGIR
jgi:ATP-dependent Clp endopeptidase proteolytic subunit ClpP